MVRKRFYPSNSTNNNIDIGRSHHMHLMQTDDGDDGGNGGNGDGDGDGVCVQAIERNEFILFNVCCVAEKEAGNGKY